MISHPGRRVVTLALLTILSLSITSEAMNPILPPDAFIPDGEPHVFEHDGQSRLYLYGSRDERVTAFCGYGHDLWSAPIDDLTNWTFHDEIFHVRQVQGIGYGKVDEQHFGAPDCVYNPLTKRYYLYTFLGAPYELDGKSGPLAGSDGCVPGFGILGPKCVMASSDRPTGPFTDPVMCDWPPANKDGAFDPSVLVDPQADGSVRVYAFWGMRKGADRWAELDPQDMHTIINPVTREPDRTAWSKTLGPEVEKRSTLFEANSIKKVAEGKYAFVYSANERKSALTYCYANSPRGPWSYGGRIVDNRQGWKGGNNHGSIVKVLDQWYVAYHRATCNSWNRQAMMEPIDLKIEGEEIIIPFVEMTSQGVESAGLDPFQRLNINAACMVTDGAYIDGKRREAGGLNPLIGIRGDHTVIGFKYFDFGERGLRDEDRAALAIHAKRMKPFQVAVSVARAGELDVRTVIATAEVDPSGGAAEDVEIVFERLDANQELAAMGGLCGKLALFLELSGPDEEFVEVYEVELRKGR